jgi:hypothetical protein
MIPDAWRDNKKRMRTGGHQESLKDSAHVSIANLIITTKQTKQL